jgi:hypothetical protein
MDVDAPAVSPLMRISPSKAALLSDCMQVDAAAFAPAVTAGGTRASSLDAGTGTPNAAAAAVPVAVPAPYSSAAALSFGVQPMHISAESSAQMAVCATALPASVVPMAYTPALIHGAAMAQAPAAAAAAVPAAHTQPSVQAAATLAAAVAVVAAEAAPAVIAAAVEGVVHSKKRYRAPDSDDRAEVASAVYQFSQCVPCQCYLHL